MIYDGEWNNDVFHGNNINFIYINIILNYTVLKILIF